MYRNAKDVLPPELLKEIQKYLCGEILYIPQKENDKACWGQKSGMRSQVNMRNIEIVTDYKNGMKINELMDTYCLSEASIRKIIFDRKRDLQTIHS